MGVASRNWVLVESMGVATGCGCKEVYSFLILLIPTPLVYALLCSSIPTVCSFFYVFRSL